MISGIELALTELHPVLKGCGIALAVVLCAWAMIRYTA